MIFLRVLDFFAEVLYNTVRSYDYDAFGKQKDNQDSFYRNQYGIEIDDNPFRYCGEYFDDETDLIYLRARYYDPDIQRFIAEDTHWNPYNAIYGDNPIELTLDFDESIELINRKTLFPVFPIIVQSNNGFVYCGNNPIVFIDASGEIASWIIVALYGYVQAVTTSPDLQFDLQMLTYDISQGDYVSAAFDIVDILAPGFSGSRRIPKFIRKYLDEFLSWAQHKKFNKMLKGSNFVRKTKGGTKMYNRSGGYKKALKDFKSLKLKNIKHYENGAVAGVMQDGTKVNLHQSHTDNMKWTLEKGNAKIRYEE